MVQVPVAAGPFCAATSPDTSAAPAQILFEIIGDQPSARLPVVHAGLVRVLSCILVVSEVPLAEVLFR